MLTHLLRIERKKTFRSIYYWFMHAILFAFISIIYAWLVNEHLENPQDIQEDIIHPLFAWIALLGMALAPLFSNHLFHEEQENKIWNLFFQSKYPLALLGLAKFINQTFMLSIYLTIFSLLPLSLCLKTHSSIFHLALSFSGVWLFLAAQLALGLFCVNLFKNKIFSSLLHFFLVIGLSTLELSNRFQLFSPIYRLKNFLNGFFHSGDLIYFILIIFICVGASCYGIKAQIFKTNSY
ncbi:MAG: ABC transporter permease [Gammaproteobacteria bacterium]